MQDDSSLGPGRYLLALFALCLLALLVFASAVSAQDSTTGASADPRAQTTPATISPSSPSATASPEATSSADELTADVPRDADEFRCKFFLHEVRGVRGNVRNQYLNSRRVERCLSKDVIPGTIVKRRLPPTGGVPLLVLGFPAIALVGAGILVARRR